MKKKFLLILLCFTLLFLTVTPAFAASTAGTPAILIKQMRKFPHLAYWNHVGSPNNNPDGVTNSPCPTHSGCSWVPGACTCNSFSNAIQCMGFAYKMGYDIVGTDPRTWEKSTTLDASKLYVGDVIRYRGNRHSLCVTGVKGNVISFADANWLPMCQIRWASMDLNDMPSFTYVLHDPNNKLKNSNIDFYLNAGTTLQTPQDTAPDDAELWQAEAGLNLRKSASQTSDKVGSVPYGAKLAVKNKKVADGYLWGKTTYSGTNGWVALNYCTYLSGKVFAPTFRDFSQDQPLNETFLLKWNAVSGADSYTLRLYDEDEKVIKNVQTNDTCAACTLNTTGTYSAVLTSGSTLAPSWVLKSKQLSFAVRNRAEITASAIKVTPATMELVPGGTATIQTTVSPYCANVSLRTSSSNPNIATIGDGIVTGKTYGKATITVTDKVSGCSAKCVVTVTPPAPKNLRQDRNHSGANKVALKWSAVPKVAGYFVYRQQADGSFRYIATTATNSFTDTGRAAGTKYVYKVKAYMMYAGEKVISQPGNAAAGVTSPAAVKKLAVATAAGRTALNWAKDKTASFYIVYRHTKNDKGFVRVATVKQNKFGEHLPSGTLVYYKVRAVKTVGKINYLSAYSAAQNVTVK